MRPHVPTMIVAVCAALSCSRAPQAAAPAPSRGENAVAPPATPSQPGAVRGDSIVQRVLYSTTTNVQGGPPGRIVGPRARMVPAIVPPRALLSDSMFSVFVIVGTNGKAKLETLKLHDGATDAQRAATREWLSAASFTLPQRDGASVEAPYEVRGRVASRALMSGGDAPPAGAVVGSVVGGVGGSSDAARAMMPRRPGELSGAQMIAIVPRVARIVSDLDTLRVRPGTPAMFASTLQIGVLDSAGAFLGYLPRYDSSIRAEIMEIDGRSVTANAEGVVSLRLSWPRSMWQGRTDSAPVVQVPVLSSRRTTDDQLFAQQVPNGFGGEGCYLQIPEVDCNVRTAQTHRVGMEDRSPSMRMIILVRRAPMGLLRWSVADSARQAYERAMRASEREIEDRGRIFNGTWGLDGQPIGYEMNRSQDSIFVGGRVFLPHWRRDSATVLLIDFRRDPRAPVVGSLVIPSTLPDDVRERRWSSGDTTFTVRPRDLSQRWKAFFDRFPAIAEFLR